MLFLSRETHRNLGYCLNDKKKKGRKVVLMRFQKYGRYGDSSSSDVANPLFNVGKCLPS